MRIARGAHDFKHCNDDSVFREAKFKSDMQRLLYNTARNLMSRERRASMEDRATGSVIRPTAAPTVDNEQAATATGDGTPGTSGTGKLVRQPLALGRHTNAYRRFSMLLKAGVTLNDFKEHLQAMMNVWRQSKKNMKTKTKVEELLILLEGTQEDGPWQELIEDWKPYLEKLPANY